MRTIIALLCLFTACQNSQSPQKEVLNSSSDSTSSSSINQPNIENTSFSELPLLATYINEIGIDDEEFGNGEDIKFVLKEKELILQNADELRFEINNNQIILEEGSSGTSGDINSKCIYQMLNKTSIPTILCIEVGNSSSRNSSVMMEDASELVEELKVDYPNLAIDFGSVAWEMVVRNEAINYGYTQPLGYDNYTATISILQKQDNNWIDITEKTFPKDFAKKLNQYSPIFSADEKGDNFNSFGLRELTQQLIDNNPSIFADWDAKIDTDGEQIRIGAGKNPPILLNWNGQQYEYKKFPNQAIALKRNACEKIDFKTDKTYTFKGNISGQEAQMDVKFKIVEAGENPTVKMTGEYFYIKNKSKMPIEGTFSTNVEKSIHFSRLKNGEARESFDGWFNSCEIKGWWQHLERLDIDKYSLKLVN